MGEDLKAALLAGDAAAEVTDTVDTHAGKVTVRPLTRAEVLNLNTGRELGKLDVAQYEAKMVALACVDPKLTEAEVRTMQGKQLAGGALSDITDKIAELSGLSEGADKSRVSRVRRKR